MTKIYVCYDTDENTILNVYTEAYCTAKGKSVEFMDERIRNLNDQAGYERFRSFEVSDELAKVFRFTLGDNEYKRTADISDVHGRLQEMAETLGGLKEEVCDALKGLEERLSEVKQLCIESES